MDMQMGLFLMKRGKQLKNVMFIKLPMNMYVYMFNETFRVITTNL